MTRDTSSSGKPRWLARWEERQQAKFDRQAPPAGTRYDDWGVRLGPFPDHPDSEFRYERGGHGRGHSWAAVDVDRVWVPTWVNVMTRRSLSTSSGGGLVALLLAVFVRLPVRLAYRLRHGRDSRWRLAVLHGRRSFPAVPRPVLLELFDTEEQADARRMEILTHWSEVDWDAKPGLGVRERRRLRDRAPD